MVRKRAFTLVELLVVITIIGILMSLLMPSLASMREAGRRTQCQNNLHQIATAIAGHVAANGRYPTGGWGYGWAGDPDRGNGIKQPGGWIYNILPFLDAGAIHDMGQGLTQQQKAAKFNQRAMIVMPIFICPSRRRTATFQFNTGADSAINYNRPSQGARSDYAANGGSIPTSSGWVSGWPSSGAGPAMATASKETDTTLATKAGAMEGNAYQTGNNPGNGPNGIVFVLSQVTSAHVRDGAGVTYMVAEKHLNPDTYTTGQDGGDCRSMYAGDYAEIMRCTREPPMHDTNNATNILNAMGQNSSLSWGFGAAHAAGFHAAFCDGSVRLIAYMIDPQVHRWMGTRDGVGRTDYYLFKYQGKTGLNAMESPVEQSQIP